MTKFITVFAFCVQIAALSVAQNTPLTTLPFELRADNRIYVKCLVNESDTLVFMFDTGAESMVINKNSLGNKLTMAFDHEVDNIGTNGTSKVQVSTKNKVSFGGIVATGVSFVAIPYDGAVFDGVMGSTFMKKYIIELNYRKRKMYFYDPKTYIYNTKDYQKLDISFSKQLPLAMTIVIIDGKKHKGKYEVDTGSDGSIMLSSPFTNRYDLIHQLKTIAHATALGSDGSKIESPIVMLPEIEFTDKHFYLIPAILSTSTAGASAYKNMDGILGNAFLKRFDLIIDMTGNHIFVKPNNLVHTPYYDFLVK